MTFRGKAFLYFSSAVLLIGVLMAFLGTRMISGAVKREAQERVTMDLRSARYIYNSWIEEMLLSLKLLGETIDPARIDEREAGKLMWEMEDLDLDFLTVCDRNGVVIFRARPPHLTGDDRSSNPLIRRALNGEPAGGTVILTREVLQREGEGLAERAYIEFIPTPKAKPRPEKAETSGMCIMAAVPIKSADGGITGALYGGVLLNRNFKLVDEIRDIIFKERWYKGKELGTVTIFQWDVRIATNVLREDGERAIGTRVSEEVYNCVLLRRKPWLERAFVVHDWYISAYEPITDPEGRVIGILYVGILEEKYNDIRNRTLLNFFLPLGAGVLIGLAFSFLLSHDLSLPMRKLVMGIERIASGDLDYQVEGKAGFAEMKQLMDHFNRMAAALKEREEQLRRANEKLRSVNRNYMEILGFVSHEIKNALGNMLMSAYNLKGGYAGELNEVQSKMVDIILRSGERLKDMIKNYLDLSRIEKGELEAHKKEVEFNEEVLNPVVEELKGQIESKGIRLTVQTPRPFKLVADPNMLRTIMDNLLSNAIKYGREGGEIRVTGGEENGFWRISVWNEGEGIPPDQLPRLFNKFTRLDTGGSRKRGGSGLGLFITREMVEKQGGRIWAESEYGRWAMFTFTLPKEGRDEA